jgi:hypothetical protein
VQIDGKWGFLNKTGEIVIPCIYDSPGVPFHPPWFDEGLAAVKKDGKCGFIDTNGDVVIPFIYDGAFQFREGLAAVNRDHPYFKIEYINKKGETVISPDVVGGGGTFSAAGLTAIQKENKRGFINKAGEIVIPCIFDMPEPLPFFSSILAGEGIPEEFKGKRLHMKYMEHCYFMDGLAGVQKDGKWVWIDTTGEIIFSISYDDYDLWSHFSDGMLRIMKDEKWGFLNKKGEVAIPLIYDYAHPFSDGLAGIQKDGKVGFINTNGDIVVPFEYDNFTLFREGLAALKKDGKWGILAIKK